MTQVALLGTEGFDIVQIDPLTVVLFNAELAQPEEASPLRWAQEGVAAPYEPYVGKPAEVDACTAASPDGYLDLELKFDTQELVAAMGEVIDGQAVKLSVTGNLRAEFGGSPFMGEDVVKVLDKGKKPQKQLLR